MRFPEAFHFGMSIFTIADLHLSISASKPMDVFGSRWQNYTERIERGWRAVVSDKDTVVIPGDISWAMRLDEADEDFRFIDRLPGRKYIVKGNHDYWWDTLTKMRRRLDLIGVHSVEFLHGSAEVVENCIICGTRGWFVEERLHNLETADFDRIVRREVLRLEAALESAAALREAPGSTGFPILVFLHFPPAFGGTVSEEIVDVMKRYCVAHCYYGHIHGRYDIPPVEYVSGIPCSIVSADYLNFIPHIIK